MREAWIYLLNLFIGTLSRRTHDPVFWGPNGFSSMEWWTSLRWNTLLPSYLDEDRDGKGSIQEFYDMKVVQVLKIIFDDLDVNDDSLVKQNGACVESFFSTVFLRNATQELFVKDFDCLDKNNDNQIPVTRGWTPDD